MSRPFLVVQIERAAAAQYGTRCSNGEAALLGDRVCVAGNNDEDGAAAPEHRGRDRPAAGRSASAGALWDSRAVPEQRPQPRPAPMGDAVEPGLSRALLLGRSPSGRQVMYSSGGSIGPSQQRSKSSGCTDWVGEISRKESPVQNPISGVKEPRRRSQYQPALMGAVVMRLLTAAERRV